MVAILGANPGIWDSQVSGEVGAFPSDDELEAAALEADGLLITRGYFNSVNNTLAKPFFEASSPIASGQNVPAHYGQISKVEVSKVAKSFATGNVNTGTGVVTITAHGLTNGAPISFTADSTGSVPTGLIAGGTYYAIVIDADTFKVADTAVDALAGVAIALTDTGSGTMYVIEWQQGDEAESLADITNAAAGVAAYVNAGAFDHLYKIDSGNFYTPARWGRIETPQYFRSGRLQANREDEPIIASYAVSLLTKNASPALFSEHQTKAENWMNQIIRDGSWEGDANK